MKNWQTNLVVVRSSCNCALEKNYTNGLQGLPVNNRSHRIFDNNAKENGAHTDSFLLELKPTHRIYFSNLATLEFKATIDLVSRNKQVIADAWNKAPLRIVGETHCK